MLINSGSSFSKGDTITLKNILGEEIMCTFVKEDITYYYITDAYALGMAQQGGMTLTPPVFSGEMTGEIKLQKIHIMWALPTEEKFIGGYKQEVTGIQIVAPSKKIITG